MALHGRSLLLLALLPLGCSTEEETPEQAVCGDADVVVYGEVGGEKLSRILKFGPNTFHQTSSFDSDVILRTLFAQQDGPFLYAHVKGGGTGAPGPAPAWVLFQEAPDERFIVSTEATLTLESSVSASGVPDSTVTFSASTLGQLPSCSDALTASGLQAEFCHTGIETDCVAQFMVADESGATVTVDVNGGGTLGDHLADLELEDGSIAIYEVDGGIIVGGILMLGEGSLDPLAVFCVGGSVEQTDHGAIARAHFTTMRRIGSLTEATPLSGELSGGSCP